MKNSKWFAIFIVVLVSVACFSAHANGIEVNITDKKGITTTVTDIKLHLMSDCKFMIIYQGVPTKTEVTWDVLPIFTGDYLVKIPFSIIQQLVGQSVTLGDGTVLTGKPLTPINYTKGSTIVGDADLGTFTISLDDMVRMSFVNKPDVTFHATPTGGSRSGTLILADNSQLPLTDLRLVTEGRNKNGCFTGEEYPPLMKFKTGESVYDLSWDKIAEIRWTGSNLVGFDLVASSGKIYTGHATNLEGETAGIQGIASINDYQLAVTIPIASKAKLILEK